MAAKKKKSVTPIRSEVMAMFDDFEEKVRAARDFYHDRNVDSCADQLEMLKDDVQHLIERL